MKVLISIQQPVMQWQIPAEGVETLRKRFPHIQFHSRYLSGGARGGMAGVRCRLHVDSEG